MRVSTRFDLTDKVAIISGGGTGIGKAIAGGLAEAGASVVLCGRRLHKCEEACDEIRERTGARALALACDIALSEDVQRMVDHVAADFGRIDILINNAGIVSNYHALELPEEEWDRVVNTNLKGYFLCSQAVGRLMARAGGGVIINISSQLGDVARPNRVHYVSAKGGVKMLTKGLAVDLAAHGIRVNAVAPGPVETEMTEPHFSDAPVRSAVLERLPIGRLGRPGDVAGAVILLASDAAAFMTGTTVYVDGGYLAM